MAMDFVVDLCGEEELTDEAAVGFGLGGQCRGFLYYYGY